VEREAEQHDPECDQAHQGRFRLSLIARDAVDPAEARTVADTTFRPALPPLIVMLLTNLIRRQRLTPKTIDLPSTLPQIYARFVRMDASL
jgi:hypothetical protein